MFDSDETFQRFISHCNSFTKNRFVEMIIIIRNKALIHIIKLIIGKCFFWSNIHLRCIIDSLRDQSACNFICIDFVSFQWEILFSPSLSIRMTHRSWPKSVLIHLVVRLSNGLNSSPPIAVVSPVLLPKALICSLAS
jgi:hypothetical protein